MTRALLRRWVSLLIDLFVTSLDAKLPLYCSLVPDPQAVFEDVFRHPWDNLDLYAFPPFPLVGRVLARVRHSIFPRLRIASVTLQLLPPAAQREARNLQNQNFFPFPLLLGDWEEGFELNIPFFTGGFPDEDDYSLLEEVDRPLPAYWKHHGCLVDLVACSL